MRRETFSAPARPESVGALRHRIEAFLSDGGVAEERLQALCLALQEALANVVRHACAAALRVTAELGPGRAVVRVHGYCEPREAGCLEAAPPEEIRPGGLGMHLIRENADEVRLETETGGRLALVLVKRT